MKWGSSKIKRIGRYDAVDECFCPFIITDHSIEVRTTNLNDTSIGQPISTLQMFYDRIQKKHLRNVLCLMPGLIFRNLNLLASVEQCYVIKD